MNYYMLFFLMILSFQLHPGAQTSLNIDFCNWLLGNWVNETKKGVIFERWERKHSKEIKGIIYNISGKDTLIIDIRRIIVGENTFIYIPTFPGKNDKKPIRLSSIKDCNSKFVFQNQSNNYPQSILYRRIGKDSLVVDIVGKLNGKLRRNQNKLKRL